MNYLGHLYITRNNPELTYGNFIGDFIKGKKIDLLSDFDGSGVRLHRSIDFFTDQHELTKKVKRFFAPKFGLYSGILVDMYFDHVFAKNWSKFNDLPLDVFSQNQYDLLDKRIKDMPEMCAYMYNYFKKDNWLLRYQTLEGTVQSLRGMTRRFNFKYDLEKSSELFLANEPAITKAFYSFISDIDNRIWK